MIRLGSPTYQAEAGLCRLDKHPCGRPDDLLGVRHRWVAGAFGFDAGNGIAVCLAQSSVRDVSDEFRPDSERYALAAFLDEQRNALVRRVEGLSEVDARRVPMASALSLLSLLSLHSAIWEERWFQGVVAGQPVAGAGVGHP